MATEIVSFPIKNCDFPISYVNVYQRVNPDCLLLSLASSIHNSSWFSPNLSWILAKVSPCHPIVGWLRTGFHYWIMIITSILGRLGYTPGTNHQREYVMYPTEICFSAPNCVVGTLSIINHKMVDMGHWMSPLNITQPLGIWSIMATRRWCPIYPKWDSYQPLVDHCSFLPILWSLLARPNLLHPSGATH